MSEWLLCILPSIHPSIQLHMLPPCKQISRGMACSDSGLRVSSPAGVWRRNGEDQKAVVSTSSLSLPCDPRGYRAPCEGKVLRLETGLPHCVLAESQRRDFLEMMKELLAGSLHFEKYGLGWHISWQLSSFSSSSAVVAQIWGVLGPC